MKYRNRFPIVVILLTAALAAFVWFVFSGSQQEDSSEETLTHRPPFDGEEGESNITSSEYRASIDVWARRFDQSLQAAGDDMETTDSVDRAMRELLEIRVPGAFQDVHLQLAVNLSQMQEALRVGSEEAFRSARDRFDRIRDSIINEER